MESSPMLCKQGAAGSIPATSTNLFPFNKIAGKFLSNITCYWNRGYALERFRPESVPEALS